MPDRPQEAVTTGLAEGGVAVSVIAPAKVNLFLHVVGRRSDGYHLIQSLFAFASFGDQLTVSANHDIRIELAGPFSQNLDAEDNLVLKAARALARAANLDNPGAKIRLCKNLPVAAGIGGGSADAAATLRALQEFWQIRMTDENLLKIALELGADIPACYVGRPMIVGGIGEEMVPYKNLPNIPLLLVHPGQEMSTHEVFAAYERQAPAFTEQIPVSSISEGIEVWELLVRTRNDLGVISAQIAPQVTRCLQEISRTSKCRLARMSGSGACCFGLYDDQQSAGSAAEVIKSLYPRWWVKAGHIQGAARLGGE